MEKFFNPVCEGADPFVLNHGGVYYLYSTSAPDGYKVKVSKDLIHWEDKGYCLKKEDVLGQYNFWAPEVTFYKGKFYLVGTAELRLFIAVSDSPLGPFKQTKKEWLFDEFSLDGHFFIDGDEVYLYYVRQKNKRNDLWVAKVNDDMVSLDMSTEKFLISATEEWETHWCEHLLKDWTTLEGPFVLKNNGKYYLTYSANDFRDDRYCIGCAVSNSPLGPFIKLDNNPILRGKGNVRGTGHHSFTTDKDGSLVIVYHCHNSQTEVEPRQTCIDRAEFIIDGERERLVVHGPTQKK